MGDVNTARPGMLDFKGACPAAPSSPPACPAGLLDREANALWSRSRQLPRRPHLLHTSSERAASGLGGVRNRARIRGRSHTEP